MDIKHEIGGDMLVTLSQADINFMKDQGYCMDRNGLVGMFTKTWVRIDQLTEEPAALIDGSNDVTVLLPNGPEDLPVQIETSAIDAYLDNDRERVEYYFGQSGSIIVRAANS